jgi:hypothetical protein
MTSLVGEEEIQRRIFHAVPSNNPPSEELLYIGLHIKSLHEQILF